MIRPDAPVTLVRARAYKVPTDKPEADGTFAWDATTLVVVHVEGCGATGLGYTYADASSTALAIAGIAALRLIEKERR